MKSVALAPFNCAGPLAGIRYMTEVLMHVAVSAGGLLPTRPHVRNTLLQIAAMIQGQQVSAPRNTQDQLAACELLPHCGVLLAGTACHAPLLRPEAAEVAALMSVSVLLVRMDVDRGLSVDIRRAHHTGWLESCRPKSCPDGLCLMPPQSNQTHLSLSAVGVAETVPPAFNGTALAHAEGGNA